jgi:Spy/CpxP family protein refolding chaperone
MKRTFLSLSGVALLAAGLTFAQDTGSTSPHPRGPGWRQAHGEQSGGFADLNLTQDQKTQAHRTFQNSRESARPVMEQLRTARQSLAAAIKNNASEAEIDRLAGQQGQLMAQVSAVHAKAFAKFYALLTAEQRSKLNDAAMERMLGGMGMGMGGPRGAARSQK